MQRLRGLVFWDVIPCSLVEMSQLSEGTGHFHLQDCIGLQMHTVQQDLFVACHHKNLGSCYAVT